MAQTRAQAAASKRRNLLEGQGKQQGALMRRSSRREAGHKSRKRTIDDIRDPDAKPSTKRPRILRPSAAGDSSDKAAADNSDPNKPTNPIDFWRREGYWPREYLDDDMEHALARKRSLPSLRRKRSDSATSTTPSDQKPREEKSAQYRDPRYEALLATKGSFMIESRQDVTNTNKAALRSMLKRPQSVPSDSLFCDNFFKTTYQKIHNRNEARVIQDISRLIVPSAESLATVGAEHLEILTESVNEGWNNSIPLTGTRPQPDYSVGFRREAFTNDQLAKLSPFIGDFIAGNLSLFMATYYMYFPFLACEVKCGAAALDTADRQNAHSMTLAARGIVELFRLINRENEVHRQILAFSVSHDHQSVRIYGYYPVIDGKETKYYRHPIRNFSFIELDGKEKWVAYRFTRNVYDIWMPTHFKRICSAIDQLPSKLEFDVSGLSESTSVSQDPKIHHLASSEADSELLLVDGDNLSRKAGQVATPDTLFTNPGPAKRRKTPAKKL
ncbi:hypothetical protein NUW58_g3393 [Xylaria curta]|uniref:Uncharacterized protein n=1 Tax=Xylaria curta TaxID=42375 RepID=A0ACC1PCS2_9PEZI|nr:hypothetical protein NUW58_g3393 [Xylaria curta]